MIAENDIDWTIPWKEEGRREGEATILLRMLTQKYGPLAADLEKAKQYFDRALEQTNRRALLTLVNKARYYAVKTGDRKLFDSLLAEVMEAEDPLPEARLANRIARVRAQLYIDYADELF